MLRVESMVALFLICSALFVQGGYVVTPDSDVAGHALMRRETIEDMKGHAADADFADSSSTGDEGQPHLKTEQKKLLERDIERHKMRRVQQQQALQKAFDEEHKYIAAVWNDTLSVPVVAVQKMEGSHFRMKGVSGRMVLNLAREKDVKSRLQHYVTWLQVQLPKHSDHLVLLSDGYSLLNGGCSDEEVHKRFNSLVDVEGTGPKVVMGAEMGPPTLSPEFGKLYEAQRKRVLQHDRLEEGLYVNVTECTFACKYEYPDFGFIMGKVKDVHKVITGVHQASSTRFAMQSGQAEQQAVMDYMMQNPQAVALDYGSKLVLSVHSMEHGKVVAIKHGVVRNKLKNETQCFVHGAGDKYEWASGFASTLRTQPN